MFSFLGYINPIWYFSLSQTTESVSLDKTDWDNFVLEMSERVDIDYGYSEKLAIQCDATYQLMRKGIGLTGSLSPLTHSIDDVSDNYRFLRRYFHSFWSLYVLILRILLLNNIIDEIRGFSKNIAVRRVDLYHEKVLENEGFLNFDSELINRRPKVSVILPTLNRYLWLKRALNDLEDQTYQEFEVIIIDQSEEYQRSFYDEFSLDIKVIRQEEKALWKARNMGVNLAQGEIIAFYEDDVRVAKDWLYNHIKCIDFFDAHISTGIFYPQGSLPLKDVNQFRLADQFSTGNACVLREVFEKINLFDCQFERQRMGDAEFGLRAWLAGYKSISNPYSFCEDAKAEIGGLRSMGSWDAFRSNYWWAPKPVPSVLYYSRKYFGNKASIYFLLKGVPPSLVPYRFKRNTKILLLGSIFSYIIFPLILPQVLLSWRLSSKMLKEGPRIGQYGPK